MAHPKHQAVRRRYQYQCGYCGVSDTDAGGELTIDHYRPVTAGWDDNDDNLVYACPRCNQYKSDYWPDEQAIAANERILHPLLDDLTHHLKEETMGHLTPLTAIGQFHIKLLHLNRPLLILHRERRRVQADQDNQLHRLQMIVEIQQIALEAIRRYLADTENMTDLPF